MSYSDAPQLLVFAGPNGSGKSTVTRNFPSVGLYVNADDIKKAAGCSDLEAARQAERLRHKLLDAKADFTFETVLSTDRNIDLLAEAKRLGYTVTVIFVLTKDPAINVERVKQRYASGGHDVPEDKIVSRYHKSLANIPKLIRVTDRLIVVDNSDDKPTVICEVIKNSAKVFETSRWSKKEILDFLTSK